MNGAGHSEAPPVYIDCASNEEAIREARRYVDKKTVEVWVGSRRVARLTPEE